MCVCVFFLYVKTFRLRCSMAWNERKRRPYMLTLRIVAVTTVSLLLTLSKSVPDCSRAPFKHFNDISSSHTCQSEKKKKRNKKQRLEHVRGFSQFATGLLTKTSRRGGDAQGETQECSSALRERKPWGKKKEEASRPVGLRAPGDRQPSLLTVRLAEDKSSTVQRRKEAVAVIAKMISVEAPSWKINNNVRERGEKKDISWRQKQGDEVKKAPLGWQLSLQCIERDFWGGGGVTAHSLAQLGCDYCPVSAFSHHTHAHTHERTHAHMLKGGGVVESRAGGSGCCGVLSSPALSARPQGPLGCCCCKTRASVMSTFSLKKKKKESQT